MPKKPDYQKQLTDCCNAVLKLCSNAPSLHSLLKCQTPDWAAVADTMERIRKAAAWLLDHWDALALFDGLRPDAVVFKGCGYRSWHAVFAESIVCDGQHLEICVWVGTDPIQDAKRWAFGPALDWSRADLGLQPGEGWADRATVWARARRMAHTIHAEEHAEALARDEKMLPDSIPETTKDVVSWRGWMDLGWPDPWEHLGQLKAEYRYAQRVLASSPPLPADRTDAGRGGGRKPAPDSKLPPERVITRRVLVQHPGLNLAGVTAKVKANCPGAKSREIRLEFEAIRARRRREGKRNSGAA